MRSTAKRLTEYRRARAGSELRDPKRAAAVLHRLQPGIERCGVRVAPQNQKRSVIAASVGAFGGEVCECRRSAQKTNVGAIGDIGALARSLVIEGDQWPDFSGVAPCPAVAQIHHQTQYSSARHQHEQSDRPDAGM